MPSQRLFTQEAAGYLIPLLDKERDAAEIADLHSEAGDRSDRLPRAITPIAVPLTDELPAHAIVDRLARVRFDADGYGPREWTWITPEAGWLVYDAEEPRHDHVGAAMVRGRDVLVVLVERLRADARARRQRGRRALRGGTAASRDLARPQSRRRLGRGRSAAARRAWHRGAVVQLRWRRRRARRGRSRRRARGCRTAARARPTTSSSVTPHRR